MTYQSSQIYEAYEPVYEVIPEHWEDARTLLNEKTKDISNAINIRQIGWFLDEELLTGQQWFPGTTNNQAFRSVFRTVIDFGALPNTSTKSVAHQVTIDANFSLTNLYLAATDPIGLTGFSLQNFANSGADIVLSYTSTDVVVTTGSDYSNYTTSFVVMEYIQEL